MDLHSLITHPIGHLGAVELGHRGEDIRQIRNQFLLGPVRFIASFDLMIVNFEFINNGSGHGEYEPPSEEEMDAELDRIEAEEAADDEAESEADEQENRPRDKD